MEKRVVITGLGAITPIGKNVKETWEGIENKRCGIDRITLFDTANFKTSLAAEVKDYNPLDYFEAKQAKRFDRSSQFAIMARSLSQLPLRLISGALLPITTGSRNWNGWLPTTIEPSPAPT